MDVALGDDLLPPTPEGGSNGGSSEFRVEMPGTRRILGDLPDDLNRTLTSGCRRSG